MNVSSYGSNYHYTQRDASLIEACFREKIVSIKDLAQILNVSLSYVYFLYKKLENEIYFKIRAVPHYKRIKLHQLGCYLSIRSTSHREIILRSLSKHDYVTYIAPYHGRGKGIYFTLLLPIGKDGDLKTFLELLLSHGVIEDYIIRPLTTIQNIVMGFEWYDFYRNMWHFNWSSLLSEVLSKVDLDPPKISDDFETPELNVRYDSIDLLILHYLEHDIFTKIGALASKAGVTRQDLSYHYRNHVHQYLVKLIRPYWLPSFNEHSTFFILDLIFDNEKALRGFIGSLQRKPIANSCALHRLSSHTSATLLAFLPYKELFNLVNFLDSLRDYGVIKDGELYILDITKSSGKALPHHCYDGFEWRFDLEPCIKEILKLAKRAHKGRTTLAKAVDKSIESK